MKLMSRILTALSKMDASGGLNDGSGLDFNAARVTGRWVGGGGRCCTF